MWRALDKCRGVCKLLRCGVRKRLPHGGCLAPAGARDGALMLWDARVPSTTARRTCVLKVAVRRSRCVSCTSAGRRIRAADGAQQGAVTHLPWSTSQAMPAVCHFLEMLPQAASARKQHAALSAALLVHAHGHGKLRVCVCNPVSAAARGPGQACNTPQPDPVPPRCARTRTARPTTGCARRGACGRPRSTRSRRCSSCARTTSSPPPALPGRPRGGPA